jgi:Domain of unknown function (DUF4258)
MSETVPPGSNMVQFQPRPDRLATTIRRLAADTSKIAWSDHARKRMHEREITVMAVLDVVRTGYPSGEVEPGKHPGEWKLKLSKPIKGRREAGVVVLVIRERRVLVKTVEWEDV